MSAPLTAFEEAYLRSPSGLNTLTRQDQARVWATIDALRAENERLRRIIDGVKALTQTLYDGVQNGAGCCGPVIGRGSRLAQVLQEFADLERKP